jgi:hypothetical protein
VHVAAEGIDMASLRQNKAVVCAGSYKTHLVHHPVRRRSPAAWDLIQILTSSFAL